MLKRTPYEFILWKALIMTTQGSMARCTVPDVLLTYELCMERMQRKHLDKRPLSPRQSDELMMKLFHNCVLFMRQSGHFDQMFALLKLVLNLNLKNDNLKCLSACEENEAPLIEYEELVLRSGMPMHEIWTRVERLRQSYNFLPYSEMVANPRDWQRCIEPMQVSPFLFPMKCVESGMQLLLLVMQMMKLPFVRTDCLAERLCSRIDQIGDSEAIETLLVEMGDRFTYSLPRHSSGLDYSTAVIQMAKQLATSPTFMSHAIGHELYVDCIAQTLLACSDGLQDSSQRLVFLLLYIRFERLRLTMLKIGGQLKAEQCVQARQRLRDLLMRPANKEITCLYTEMAITEYETAPNNENVERSSKILNIILGTSPDYQDTQMVQALVVRVELLLAQEKRTEALHLLKCLALGKSPSSRPDEIIATPDELVQCSTRLLDAALAAMREQAGGAVDPMPLCDYFAPNRVVLLLRTHCLMLCLLNEVDKAFELLDRLLAEPHFALEPKELERTRCRFLREQVRELQLLLVFHIPSRHNTLGRRLRTVLEPALVEFPRNMAFLHRWSELWTLPWYKLRSRLIQCKVGILSVLHLIIAAHMRFSQYFSRRGDVEEDVQSAQQNQRLLQYNRSLNIFETFLPTNPHRSAEEADQYWILRRNSLYWRLYLRCLSTEQTSFERSKRCLLMALDECPWDKSLYMEGITSVPQETSNMQDIMIEKEVRIFALPDELSVLRDANQKNISKY
ncbi:protein NRDE2 homolog [Drosophila navojoa]|nr:protein NRDE2 homolog [Drosophila navojoa]